EPGHIGGYVNPDQDSFVVQGIADTVGIGSSVTSGSDGDGRQAEFVRSPACQSGLYRHDLSPRCTNSDPIVELCLDGSQALDPVWVRYSNAGGEWGDWTMLYWYYCP